MEPPRANFPADWYPDPFGRFEYRFHNGAAWTADVSSQGNRYVDPLGFVAVPGPAAGGALLHAGGPKRDGIATAAMVLGIIGMSISWVPFLFVPGAICALLGLTFGTVTFRRRRPQNRAFAITGAATGAAGILMVGVGVWTTSLVFGVVDEYENPPPYDVDITRCAFSDGALVVEGSVENLGDRASDYRVVVRIPGERTTTRRNAVFEVADLEPGDTATFTEQFPRRNALDSQSEPTCAVRRVTGPLPFGVNLESN